MSRASPQMRDFAKRLIVCETGGNGSSLTKTVAASHVLEKLRPHLATMMGDGGFRALLSRALALASTEVPGLRAVRVKTDGTLDGWEELLAKPDPDQLFEGSVVLLAQLLGLLEAFIGESLTVRLVSEVWPKVSFNELNFGNGEKHEKSK